MPDIEYLSLVHNWISLYFNPAKKTNLEWVTSIAFICLKQLLDVRRRRGIPVCMFSSGEEEVARPSRKSRLVPCGCMRMYGIKICSCHLVNDFPSHLLKKSSEGFDELLIICNKLLVVDLRFLYLPYVLVGSAEPTCPEKILEDQRSSVSLRPGQSVITLLINVSGWAVASGYRIPCWSFWHYFLKQTHYRKKHFLGFGSNAETACIGCLMECFCSIYGHTNVFVCCACAGKEEMLVEVRMTWQWIEWVECGKTTKPPPDKQTVA